MKKLLYPFILLVLLTGCDAVSLEEEPKTFLSENQFFRNAGDAEAAVNSAYAAFSDQNYYGTYLWATLVMHADYADGRGSWSPAGSFEYDDTNVQRMGLPWSSIYESINRANLVLDRVPDIEMDSDLKNQYLGEARFVRALNYFNLVRLFGPVPLRTAPSEGLEGLSVSRAPVDDVYNLILEDLQFAETNLPSTYSASEAGRATRWAAKALLAEVYLTREQWSDAATKAQEVIDQGPFELVRVETSDDFDQIYGPEIATHSEEIFAVHFNRSNKGQTINAYIHHQNAGYSAAGYRAVIGDMGTFISDWDDEDLRKAYNLYVTPEEQEFLSSAEPMLFKKFKDPQGDGGSGHANDLPILRLADALLIYAEAASQANGGPTSDAYEAVNKVRRRAHGLDPDTPAPAVDLSAGMTAEQFQDAVLMERAKEFMIEGKRWFDLVRTNKAIEKISALGEPIDEHHLLWPIPQEEIEENEALSPDDQNPGW